MKTVSQQEEQLKRMDSLSALQEANRMLKMDRDKREQELQQAQAKVRLSLQAQAKQRCDLLLLAVAFDI